MANPDEDLTVAQRLGRALDRGLLPAGGPAEAAERLIERLERPARLALLGLPGSGKSSILNLLVGAPVIPETLRLPTIIVQHGTTARMVCTLTDGSSKTLPGSNLADVLPLAPALVTVELDLAALKVISLLEVSAGPMEAEQKRAANWAAKRSDIVIWCTTSYLPKEQAVWESLPDAVKDNSFMFLTKIDLLGSKQSAAAMHDRVELRAGEEFRQILSVSAKEARAAVPPGGPVNRELFRESGAAAVIAAIKTRVQSGRRADMDTAELLLARHVEASELVARRFAEPGGEAEAKGAWVPPPEPEPEPARHEPVVEARSDEEAPVEEPEIVSSEGPADAAEPEAGHVPEPEPEPESRPEPEPTPEPEPSGSQAAAVDEPEDGSATPRKRFADRIKRVATAGEPAPSAKVPLRSTWKSKAELEAQAAAAPDLGPTEKSQPPSRRPRAGVATPAEAGSGDAQPGSPVPPVVPEAEIASGVPPEPERSVVPRERPQRGRPQALTPRPEADVEGANSESPAGARIKGFGMGRKVEGLVRGAPLPDLSSLRARPEELAEADEPEGEEALDPEADEAAPEMPEREHDEDVAPSAEVDVPEVAASPSPEPEPAPARAVERPRLFGREARPRPSDPGPPSAPVPPAPVPPSPRTAPVTRLPASARARPAAATPQPAPPEPGDAALLTPRAIMMRDRPSGAEQPPPRRERPRIAPLAVPVGAAPSAPAPDTGADAALADQAVALIVSRTAELAQEVDPEAKVPVDLILDHTRETSEQLMTLVSQGRSGAMRRINAEIGEVLDLIMLMQLEKGHAPADDALTLLLQLRRELETLRAV
ncbi:hypothetical protein [Tabrizicola flagellatus]|uniref:hypothetical protein n=1 Tax=Tabrizicola flagellatus TaxID=2593021 RepID=UPI0011F256B7|nr:hypothetical protein [Tabrizicola flagellatus]